MDEQICTGLRGGRDAALLLLLLRPKAAHNTYRQKKTPETKKQNT